MQYSPKLKIAMEEIKEILKRNDIAGVIVLHALEDTTNVKTDAEGFTHVRGYTEFMNFIETSYSAASLAEGRYQVKNALKHYASRQERDIKIAGTFNMLEHLSEWVGKSAMLFFEMLDALKTITESKDNGPGDYTSHTQQNN